MTTPFGQTEHFEQFEEFEQFDPRTGRYTMQPVAVAMANATIPKTTTSTATSVSKTKRTQPISYSGYTCTKVTGMLRRACVRGDYETCCHWAAEMVLSGWTHLVWDELLMVSSTHIHIHNPRIVLLLLQIQNDYPALLSTHAPVHDANVRQGLVYAIGVVCYSPKGVVYTKPVIHCAETDVEYMIDCMKGLSISENIRSIKKNADAHILCVFMDTLQKYIAAKNLNKALRVLGWLFHFENSKTLKTHVQSDTRHGHADWRFFLWDIFFMCIPIEGHAFQYREIIQAWKLMFTNMLIKNSKPLGRACKGTLPSSKTLKSSQTTSIFVTILLLLTQSSFENIQCIYKKEMIESACENVDTMFQEIIEQKKQSLGVCDV